KAIVRSCSSSTLTTDYVPNGEHAARFSAMNKIIGAKLSEENERPVNGVPSVSPLRDFAASVLATEALSWLGRVFSRPCSDAGANRSQQEGRKMGVIGGL